MIWAGPGSQHVDQLHVAGSGPFTFTTPLHLRRLEKSHRSWDLEKDK
ncbi:unnamed protein product [Arabidopsis halleri]